MLNQETSFKWDKHASDILSVLETFQQNDMLVDVTLSCQGQNIKAHKTILAACSPYFQNLFMDNPCRHPVVPILGVNFEDIKAILHFMYKGEVNVPHGGRLSFLKAAETLEVKGLAEMCSKKRRTNSIGFEEDQESEHGRPQKTDALPMKTWINKNKSLDIRELSNGKPDDEALFYTADSSVKHRIFVKNLTGKILTLEVEPSETIWSLKVKIQDKEGDLMVNRRLIFDDQELEDSLTISDYNIKNHSLVHMVLKDEPRDTI